MKRKHMLIGLLVLICSFLSFRAYQNWELSKLHHRYETSLAKALKNSYRDIEEIHFANPVYSDKPGDWNIDVKLIFKDRVELKYRTSHALSENDNHSPIVGGQNGYKILDELDSRVGRTDISVKVYYSNGETEENYDF